MNTVTVRNIEIGRGIPKICVPIVGHTEEEILSSAAAVVKKKADIAEWRADWYEDVFEEGKVLKLLQQLRNLLKEVPLLFTFRTAAEGGEKQIAPEAYKELLMGCVKSGQIDLIDIELFIGNDIVKDLIRQAEKNGVKVILSNHDFQETPDKEELVSRLKQMAALGADIPKIAVMPQSAADVLTLLSATDEAANILETPVITMSMAGTGLISRLCGEVFGSAVTFGAAGQISAPGQIDAEDLRDILMLLHSSGSI